MRGSMVAWQLSAPVTSCHCFLIIICSSIHLNTRSSRDSTVKRAIIDNESMSQELLYLSKQVRLACLTGPGDASDQGQRHAPKDKTPVLHTAQLSHSLQLASPPLCDDSVVINTSRTAPLVAGAATRGPQRRVGGRRSGPACGGQRGTCWRGSAGHEKRRIRAHD